MQNDNYSYKLLNIFCLEFIQFNEFLLYTLREITVHGTDMLCDPSESCFLVLVDKIV